MVFEQQKVFERAPERDFRRVNLDLAETRQVERLLLDASVLVSEALLDVLHCARARAREVANLLRADALEAADL